MSEILVKRRQHNRFGSAAGKFIAEYIRGERVNNSPE
jgi:hypothetical protein